MNRCTTYKSIESLISKLNFSDVYKNSQDWHYMVSDTERIAEFVSYYKNESLSEEEKFTLMIIIIESCNDALESAHLDKYVWDKVVDCLIIDRNIHKDTIEYWSNCGYADLEDCCEVTKLIRKIGI